MDIHGLEPSSQTARPPGYSSWRLDAVVVAVLLAGWLVGLTGPVLCLRPIAPDTYRDAAYAEHILEGRWSDDPALLGYRYWYPPLGPLVYSLIGRTAGTPPLAVYGTSVLWANIWILPILYLLVRRSFDRLTGVTAVLCVWLGSRWWSDNLALPVPAVQGLVPALATLWLWVEVQAAKLRWSVPVAILLAICAWHHVICGLVTSGAIGLHALACTVGCRPGSRWQPLLRAAVVAAICGMLVAPLAWHLASLPQVNRIPFRYVATELFNPRYSRHALTPLVIPLAIAGVVYVLRRAGDKGAWVIGYLLVGLVGQAPAYLRRFVGRSLPLLVPHEFQWHGQLAVGILAAIALVWIAREAAGYRGRVPGFSSPRSAPFAVGCAWACLVMLVIGPDAADAVRRIDDRWISSRPLPAEARAADWIKRNTGVYDVFLCHPQTGYRLVGGLTGRKLVAPLAGYANVAAPVPKLHEDNKRLLKTDDPDEFRRLAVNEHQVQYLLVEGSLLDRLPRWRRWDLFDEVYADTDDGVVILGLRPGPSR